MYGIVRPATEPDALMDVSEPQHDHVTRADLDALKADVIRELASKAEVEQLRADLTAAISRSELRDDELRKELGPMREILARLDERMKDLAKKEEVARLDARLTWRIVVVMVVLTAIFSAIVAILTRTPGG